LKKSIIASPGIPLSGGCHDYQSPGSGRLVDPGRIAATLYSLKPNWYNVLSAGGMTGALRKAYNFVTCGYGVGVPYQADQFTDLSLAAWSRIAVE